MHRKGDILKEIPQLFFHISYSFHKWFLYYKGDFNPGYLRTLKDKVSLFETIWASYEKSILTLIPKYVGASWPFREIHVYCFENPEYYAVPCISDPLSINMSGGDLQLFLLYLIHELVHFIMQFDERFSKLSLDAQEAAAYFVGNRVLEDILGHDAHFAIEAFTVPWPYDFPRIAREYKGIIDLDQSTIRELIEQGSLL